MHLFLSGCSQYMNLPFFLQLLMAFTCWQLYDSISKWVRCDLDKRFFCSYPHIITEWLQTEMNSHKLIWICSFWIWPAIGHHVSVSCANCEITTLLNPENLEINLFLYNALKIKAWENGPSAVICLSERLAQTMSGSKLPRFDLQRISTYQPLTHVFCCSNYVW